MDLSGNRGLVYCRITSDRCESQGRCRCLQVVDAVYIRVEAKCTSIKIQGSIELATLLFLDCAGVSTGNI